MEVIYIGPTCPRCANWRYTILTLGGNDYKRCVECLRLTPVVEGELTPEEA
jgi:hypothetical protein